MKRPIYSVLAALAVSAAFAGSAYAADEATQGNTRINTQMASSAVTRTRAASPMVSRDSVRGGAGEVHVMKRSAIPDGWWKEDN